MESILNPPRRVAPRQKAPEPNIRNSIVFLIVGVALAALGGITSSAETETHFGVALLWLGVFSLVIGLLVEFFSIGTSLRSIVRLLESHDERAKAPERERNVDRAA